MSSFNVSKHADGKPSCNSDFENIALVHLFTATCIRRMGYIHNWKSLSLRCTQVTPKGISFGPIYALNKIID